MNPVMALGMKQNAVRGTSGTAHHTGDTVMQAPARDPGDFGIALRAKSTLLMPEMAKSVGTPKRFQHVSPFAFFEVGFIGWIVRVSFAFYLDVSFDGSALGVVQPNFIWPSLVIAGFIEEGPIAVPAPFKIF
jgi:hypothetical protein